MDIEERYNVCFKGRAIGQYCIYEDGGSRYYGGGSTYKGMEDAPEALKKDAGSGSRLPFFRDLMSAENRVPGTRKTVYRRGDVSVTRMPKDVGSFRIYQPGTADDDGEPFGPALRGFRPYRGHERMGVLVPHQQEGRRDVRSRAGRGLVVGWRSQRRRHNARGGPGRVDGTALRQVPGESCDTCPRRTLRIHSRESEEEEGPQGVPRILPTAILPAWPARSSPGRAKSVTIRVSHIIQPSSTSNLTTDDYTHSLITRYGWFKPNQSL